MKAEEVATEDEDNDDDRSLDSTTTATNRPPDPRHQRQQRCPRPRARANVRATETQGALYTCWKTKHVFSSLPSKTALARDTLQPSGCGTASRTHSYAVDTCVNCSSYFTLQAFGGAQSSWQGRQHTRKQFGSFENPHVFELEGAMHSHRHVDKEPNLCMIHCARPLANFAQGTRRKNSGRVHVSHVDQRFLCSLTFVRAW